MGSVPPSLAQDKEHPAAPFIGLTGEEAKDASPNTAPMIPRPVRRGALARELLGLFLNPLVIILLLASTAIGRYFGTEGGRSNHLCHGHAWSIDQFRADLPFATRHRTPPRTR